MRGRGSVLLATAGTGTGASDVDVGCRRPAWSLEAVDSPVAPGGGRTLGGATTHSHGLRVHPRRYYRPQPRDVGAPSGLVRIAKRIGRGSGAVAGCGRRRALR